MRKISKEKSLRLLVIILFSFVLSILMQALFFSIDIERFSGSSDNVTPYLFFVGYEKTNGYYEVNDTDPQILFWSQNESTSAVSLTFSRPISESISIDVFYATTIEDGFYEEAGVYEVLRPASTQVLINIPPGEYELIRIDIGDEVGDRFALEEVRVYTEPIGFFAQSLAKISVLQSLFITAVLALILCFFTEKYNIMHFSELKKGLQICKSPWFGLLILGVLSFLCGTMTPFIKDDVEYFWQILHDSSWFGLRLDFHIFRYSEWTSRNIIEFFLVFVVQNKLLWNCLNTGMILLTCYSIAKITHSNTQKSIWVIVGIFSLYPMQVMQSAGWIATSMNYLWPLALGLYASLPLVSYYAQKPLRKWEYPLFVLATIYAANQEQMASILFVFYLLTLGHALFKKQRNIFICVQTFLVLAGFVHHLVCPGNQNRRTMEMELHFPSFDNIPFLNKLEMGFSSTLYKFVMEPNLVFILFALLLFLCVFHRYKQKNDGIFQPKWASVLAAVPLLAGLVFGTFAFMLSTSFTFLPVLTDALSEYGLNPEIQDPISFFPLLMLFFILICILISVYNAFENKKQALLIGLIFLSGLFSRLIMSFSPSIWESGERTFIFMYFSIMICSVFLYLKVNLRYQKAIDLFLLIAASLSWIEYIYHI